MGRVVTAIALVALIWSSPPPAAGQAASPLAAPQTPLVVGWERFFRVTGEPLERKGRPHVAGYVFNDWGAVATRVQLLVDGLDSSGRVVSQTVTWVGSSIPPGSRVYFEVRAPQPAASFRVSVFAYEFARAGSG